MDTKVAMILDEFRSRKRRSVMYGIATGNKLRLQGLDCNRAFVTVFFVYRDSEGRIHERKWNVYGAEFDRDGRCTREGKSLNGFLDVPGARPAKTPLALTGPWYLDDSEWQNNFTNLAWVKQAL